MHLASQKLRQLEDWDITEDQIKVRIAFESRSAVVMLTSPVLSAANQNRQGTLAHQQRQQG